MKIKQLKHFLQINMAKMEFCLGWILVRFAELKAIQELYDTCVYFQMARENYKKFTFVHIHSLNCHKVSSEKVKKNFFAKL